MELDTMTIIVIVVLLIVGGVFIGTQFVGKTSSNAVSLPSSQAQYGGGGGCGR